MIVTRLERHAAFGDLVVLTQPHVGEVVAALHGGHVLSWKPADGHERLFLSSLATMNGPIRGGIPVCFPQFAGYGPLPKHGFARTAAWRHRGGGEFVLDVSPEAWSGWPHPCSLMISVELGPQTLTVSLTVDNVGPKPFSFSSALHTYLRVADIDTVTIDGFRESPIFFEGEVDRVIAAPPTPAVVRAEGVAQFVCAQTGFIDSVVWNIGEEKAAGMSDLGHGEWRNYVCIEAATVEPAEVLAPGARWRGSQTLISDPREESVASVSRNTW